MEHIFHCLHIFFTILYALRVRLFCMCVCVSHFHLNLQYHCFECIYICLCAWNIFNEKCKAAYMIWYQSTLKQHYLLSKRKEEKYFASLNSMCDFILFFFLLFTLYLVGAVFFSFSGVCFDKRNMYHLCLYHITFFYLFFFFFFFCFLNV